MAHCDIVMHKTASPRSRLSGLGPYTIFDHGRAIGRIYEERAAPPNLRWYWCITIIGASFRHPHRRAGHHMEQAKAQF
jgi:hypothetical protein